MNAAICHKQIGPLHHTSYTQKLQRNDSVRPYSAKLYIQLNHVNHVLYFLWSKVCFVSLYLNSHKIYSHHFLNNLQQQFLYFRNYICKHSEIVLRHLGNTLFLQYQLPAIYQIGALLNLFSYLHLTMIVHRYSTTETNMNQVLKGKCQSSGIGVHHV